MVSVAGKNGEDFAGDVALQESHDLGFRLAVGGAPFDVDAVRGSLLMRVSAMRQRAWLAWRSPPRLSRWRVRGPNGHHRHASEPAAPHSDEKSHFA